MAPLDQAHQKQLDDLQQKLDQKSARVKELLEAARNLPKKREGLTRVEGLGLRGKTVQGSDGSRFVFVVGAFFAVAAPVAMSGKLPTKQKNAPLPQHPQINAHP